MKKGTILVVGVGAMLVAGTGAALTPFDASTVKVLVPKPGAPAVTAKLPTSPTSVGTLSAATKAAAMAKVKTTTNLPKVTATQGSFTLSASAPAAVPTGLSLWENAPLAVGPVFTGRPPPAGVYFNPVIGPVAAMSSMLVIKGVPTGNWFVTCTISEGGTFNVQVVTSAGVANDSMSLSDSGITFAASIASSPDNSITIWSNNSWIWQSCLFDPVQ